MSDEIKELTEEKISDDKELGTQAGTGETDVRQALEEAREAESKAYHKLSHSAALTSRQKGVMELSRLEEIESPDKAVMDMKCRLILESYYLPHILKTDYTVKLDQDFTRFDEPGRDYIEAVFTSSTGKEKRIGYNYKPDEDGRNLLLFEKTFENVILKPGDPERYVLYDTDGVTELKSFFMEDLQQSISKGEVVQVEDEYFLKAMDGDGKLREGTTTRIIEEESTNVKIIVGNNEQEKYSFNKAGQLVCAITNDVTTVTLESRKLNGSGPIYDTADAARAAAEKELREGESNLRVDVAMEGTTMANFNYVPAYTTSIELAGASRKLGKGIEGFDPNESDEENLRRQFAKPITEYLVEKGFYVIDISCERLEADIKENVGFMNTIRTFHMTGGVVMVTYLKKLKAMVTLKQGFLGRGQSNNVSAILAQLPEGSELLNPQDINWKSSKLEVEYVVRGNVTGVGSAKTIPEADVKAAENAVIEAQKVVAKGLNGGIASGIREVISANGAVSTVASVRARLDTATVSKEDMELTHKDPKFAYSGSCDRMNSSVENKLVAVTTWNGSKLTYVEPTDPIIDRGIPTDENYDKYIGEGDDLGIILFEKTDRGLHRYMDDVLNAQKEAKVYRQLYGKARKALEEAQAAFDKMIDEKLWQMDQENGTDAPVAETMTAREALEAIFGETTDETAPTEEVPDDVESPEEPAGEAAQMPQVDLESDEDVDAAFERLLMGMPKE